MAELNPPRVALRIGDTDWLGWTEVEIVMTMEAVAGQFTIGTTDRWPGQTSYRPISPGDACTVALDGEPVITGYIDVVMPFYTHTEHSFNVTGRDKTGDIVDCAPEGVEWKGLTLPQLVSAIAEPFGIPVVSQLDDPGPTFQKFTVQQGEEAWAAIDRAAKARAALAMSDGKGNLVLTRAATSTQDPPPIILSENVLKGTGVFAANEKFSRYVIKAQQGGRDGSPEDRAHVIAEATDGSVGRERTMVIIARDRMDQPAALAAVQWEANVRRGRATRVSYTIPGWRDQAGRLWRPNTIARVRDEWLSVDKDLLVVSVRLTISADGVLADLDLSDPAAYMAQPPESLKKTKEEREEERAALKAPAKPKKKKGKTPYQPDDLGW